MMKKNNRQGFKKIAAKDEFAGGIYRSLIERYFLKNVLLNIHGLLLIVLDRKRMERRHETAAGTGRTLS